MYTKITMGNDGKILVPNNPTIPFIEGDGIGPDIWAESERVFDAAVEKAYAGEKKINWLKVLAYSIQYLNSNTFFPTFAVQNLSYVKNKSCKSHSGIRR